MTIDERLEALTESAELLLLESREHTKQLEKDGENIRLLAAIAQSHHDRLMRLEDQR
jgi:hypothetical protein